MAARFAPEVLLRKLLRMKSRPAVVMLHHWRWAGRRCASALCPPRCGPLLAPFGVPLLQVAVMPVVGPFVVAAQHIRCCAIADAAGGQPRGRAGKTAACSGIHRPSRTLPHSHLIMTAPRCHCARLCTPCSVRAFLGLRWGLDVPCRRCWDRQAEPEPLTHVAGQLLQVCLPGRS